MYVHRSQAAPAVRDGKYFSVTRMASIHGASYSAACSGGLGDESVDVAIFRFTLGIPGFDDDLVPRVVGILCAVLLAGNHWLGGSDPSAAQVIQCGLQPGMPITTAVCMRSPAAAASAALGQASRAAVAVEP